MLIGIIQRHNDLEDILNEAEKQFKWNRSQSEAAVKPLLKRNTFAEEFSKPTKKTSKRSTKRK